MSDKSKQQFAVSETDQKCAVCGRTLIHRPVNNPIKFRCPNGCSGFAGKTEVENKETTE